MLFGLKDNPNDFVGALGRLTRPMRQMYVHAVQSLIWNQLASKRIQKSSKIMVGDLVQPDENQKLQVFDVTADNIKDFTIDQVVLTMPGFDVRYSKVIEPELDPILTDLGLTRDSFAGKVKDYRLPGAYRKLIARPKNFDAKLVTYSKEDENLLKSERDTLPELMGEQDKSEEKEEVKDLEAKMALIVEFELPTGRVDFMTKIYEIHF